MSIMREKLADGVLRVVTPLGPRYINPSFLQRVYLVWMFRHFATLPHQVLRSRQQKMIDRLCTSHPFVSQRPHNGREQAPIVGTVERRPLVLVDKPRARWPVVAFAESAFQALFAASRLNSDKGVIVRLSRLAYKARSGRAAGAPAPPGAVNNGTAEISEGCAVIATINSEISWPTGKHRGAETLDGCAHQ
jgi:hypothetical protein